MQITNVDFSAVTIDTFATRLCHGLGSALLQNIFNKRGYRLGQREESVKDVVTAMSDAVWTVGLFFEWREYEEYG